MKVDVWNNWFIVAGRGEHFDISLELFLRIIFSKYNHSVTWSMESINNRCPKFTILLNKWVEKVTVEEKPSYGVGIATRGYIY